MDRIPRPEYPRPDFRRERWLSLNGEWALSFDPARSGVERVLFEQGRALDSSILVPYPPESRLSGVGALDFHECLWYKRTFDLPDAWKNGRVLLNFGAVDYAAYVWINGKRLPGLGQQGGRYLGGGLQGGGALADHVGGYTPFRLDITPLLLACKNEICLMAVDMNRSPLQPRGKQSSRFESFGCHYTRVSGIWQTVWLESVGETYVSGLRIAPDALTGEVAVTVSPGGEMRPSGLEIIVSRDGKEVARAEGTLRCPSSTLTLKAPEPEVWDVGKGVLYDLLIRLGRDGKVLDEVRSYFGFRDFRIEGNKFLLNGRPLFLRTVLDQGYYPDGIYTAPSEEALKQDIEMSMALGFDGARLHQKVFEPLFLCHADKAGYLVWGEYANWGLDLRREEALLHFLPEWSEAVERDRNHPSVIGWCPLNETPREQISENVLAVYEVSKRLDPTRPVIDTSGYVQVRSDVYDVHNYNQNPEELRKQMEPLTTGEGEVWRNFPDHEMPYQGQPYYVSEYGGTWWSEKKKAGGDSWGYGDRPRTKEEYIERYRALTGVLLDNPGVAGFCYTQLYDVEQEQNGLLTYEREPKVEPSVIKKINQRKAAVEQ